METKLSGEVNNGKLTIWLEELVNALPEEVQIKIARNVGTKPDVYRTLCEMLVHPADFFIGDPDDDEPWWHEASMVHELRMKLLPLMPTIAKNIIARAMRARVAAERRLANSDKWNRDLRAAWPGSTESIPEPPPYEPTQPITGEDIDAYVAKLEDDALNRRAT